jgi:hypothetical protein
VRLDVGELALEELLGALDGQRLGLSEAISSISSRWRSSSRPTMPAICGSAFARLAENRVEDGAVRRPAAAVDIGSFTTLGLGTPKRRAALISWRLPGQQGDLLRHTVPCGR